MMRIINVVQFCVLTVDCQSVLSQVVSSDTEEINFFCKKVTDHNSSRCLDHDTLLHIITERDTLLRKLCFHFCYDRFNLFYFCYGDDHRIHDGNISEHACTEKCTQLCLEYFRTVQADTDRTISHSRVLLMCHIEIIDLLVCSDIKGTDDDFLTGHVLCYCLINLELLFLCRIIFFLQIYKFASEKSDTFRIIGKYVGNIAGTSNVCIKMKLTAALGNSLFSFQFFEHCTLCKFICTQVFVFLKGFRIRINDQISALSVYNCHFSVHGLVVFDIDQCRNVHSSCKNGGM